MSVRRALVDCSVLSLRDSCVFYPCCKGCFSRIDADQLDTTRYRCSRCGYSCLRDQVDFRYRLALMVARDMSIFGVTVFGNSLNAFFGIHANGLQRIVENLEGPVEPSTRSRLLLKAVRDCFIGRHFIFGLKLTAAGGVPWFGDPGSDGSNSRESTQFVASQMILPKAMCLTGCSVLSYFQALLLKTSEYEDGSADPAAPLLLNPGPSPSCSFNNTTLQVSGFSLSLPGSHPDSMLTPAALWQKSLGVITSSAEQEEEGCSTQGSGEDNNTSPLPAQEDYLEKHQRTEERTSLLPLNHSLCNNPLYTDYSSSSFRNVVGSSFSVNTCFSPSQPGHKRYSLTPKELSTRCHAQSILSSSLVWEDLSFSESLSEFLHEQNKDFESPGEKRPNLNLQNDKQTSRASLKITDLTVESTSGCQKTIQIRTSSSPVLSDIINTPAPDGRKGKDLSDQELGRSEIKSFDSHDCNQEDDKGVLSFIKEEEQLEENSYNCSADLFSNSLMSSSNRETLNTQSIRSTSGTSPLFSKTEHLRNENVSHFTPHKPKLKATRSNNRDSLSLQEFDFVPPSQSTPIMKVCAVTQSPSTSHRNTTSESSKENLTWRMRSSRQNNKSTPRRRFRKTDEPKECKNFQSLWLQRQTLSCESSRTTRHKSRVSDVTVCDYEDDEGLVALTPVGKLQQSCTFKRRRETENRSSGLSLFRKGSLGHEITNKTLTASHRSQTDDNEIVDEESLNGSDGANQTCDWSRDLFSDSV